MFNWLELSPIDFCNRKCVFCPKVDDRIAPDQKNNFMPPILYEKIASELTKLKYTGTVMLAGYGEPMVAKNIYDMISVFSKVANTEITTNGDLINQTTIKKLISAGINKIIVSLYDGPEQIDHFNNLFASVDGAKDRYILRDRWYGKDVEHGLKLTNRAGTLPETQSPKDNVDHPCYYPHYMMMIDWNGDTFLCTQDWNRRIRSGNLMLQPLIDIWNSNTLKRYRSHLAGGKRDLSPCNNCNAEGTLHGLKHAECWQTYYKNKCSSQTRD